MCNKEKKPLSFAWFYKCKSTFKNIWDNQHLRNKIKICTDTIVYFKLNTYKIYAIYYILALLKARCMLIIVEQFTKPDYKSNSKFKITFYLSVSWPVSLLLTNFSTKKKS